MGSLKKINNLFIKDIFHGYCLKRQSLSQSGKPGHRVANLGYPPGQQEPDGHGQGEGDPGADQTDQVHQHHEQYDIRVVPLDNFMIYKDIIRLDRPD